MNDTKYFIALRYGQWVVMYQYPGCAPYVCDYCPSFELAVQTIEARLGHPILLALEFEEIPA